MVEVLFKYDNFIVMRMGFKMTKIHVREASLTPTGVVVIFSGSHILYEKIGVVSQILYVKCRGRHFCATYEIKMYFLNV